MSALRRLSVGEIGPMARRRAARVHRLSLNTEKTYVSWARRFILYHDKKHPKDMAEPEINAFLTHLAADLNVAASTQTQALCALLFLYRIVLKKQVGELKGLIRAKKKRRLPVVLTQGEVRRVIDATTSEKGRLYLRTQGPENYHDLRSRAEPRRERSAESAGRPAERLVGPPQSSRA